MGKRKNIRLTREATYGPTISEMLGQALAMVILRQTPRAKAKRAARRVARQQRKRLATLTAPANRQAEESKRCTRTGAEMTLEEYADQESERLAQMTLAHAVAALGSGQGGTGTRSSPVHAPQRPTSRDDRHANYTEGMCP